MYCKFNNKTLLRSFLVLSLSPSLSPSLHTCSMCMVLHPHSHGHNHGASGHSNKKKKNQLLEDSRNEGKGEVSGSGRKRRFWQRKNRQRNKHGSEENINVRAAFIHVIGDLIQSIGVVIAGYIIKFKVRKCAYQI